MGGGQSLFHDSVYGGEKSDPLYRSAKHLCEPIIPWSVSSETTVQGASNSPRNSEPFGKVNSGLKEFYSYVIHPYSDESPICGKPGDEDCTGAWTSVIRTNQPARRFSKP